MNLLEAIESGKPFRRRRRLVEGLDEFNIGVCDKREGFVDTLYFIEEETKEAIDPVLTGDLLAEDYEVRDEPS